jgi:hypothetical protein
VWRDPKEWCEVLWDNSFTYERHEKKAYSWAWNDTVLRTGLGESTFDKNPNNLILPDKLYPTPCPSYDFALDAQGKPLPTEV